jgi:hypothetical protein
MFHRSSTAEVSGDGNPVPTTLGFFLIGHSLPLPLGSYKKRKYATCASAFRSPEVVEEVFDVMEVQVADFLVFLIAMDTG